jgi:hypothetical protein
LHDKKQEIDLDKHGISTIIFPIMIPVSKRIEDA